MPGRIIGVETEYAFVPRSRAVRNVPRGTMLRRLMRLARERLPHLPEPSNFGLYLGNGARFYVDVGMHPEMCTPECGDPWDVVRYVKAGERILDDLATEVVADSPDLDEIQFLRSNVDYGGTGSTWGCHESYLHTTSPTTLPALILPHLVSRIVYSGAGGFDPESPGLEFMLSPRVAHIRRAISGSSTSDRGIFHTKDESLAGPGFHRLHILCGNSLGSETALWLTVATTALVVALAEAGKIPVVEIEIADPVAAMRAFARDPSCRTAVQMTNGRLATAVAIQRHYLRFAESCLGSECMPAWAEEACRLWRAMLDDLEGDTGELWRRLDWAIRLSIYDDRLRRRGMDWERVASWTEFVTRHMGRLEDMVDCVTDIPRGLHAVSLDIDQLVPAFASGLEAEGLDAGDLRRFLMLRLEFFEIDMRFAQIDRNGIFNALDSAGVLRHRIVDPGSIERAMVDPPRDTRACPRGEFIKRVWGDDRPRACSWDKVWDIPEKRLMDLANPFEIGESWKPSTRPPVLLRRRPGPAEDTVTGMDLRAMELLGF